MFGMDISWGMVDRRLKDRWENGLSDTRFCCGKMKTHGQNVGENCPLTKYAGMRGIVKEIISRMDFHMELAGSNDEKINENPSSYTPGFSFQEKTVMVKILAEIGHGPSSQA